MAVMPMTAQVQVDDAHAGRHASSPRGPELIQVVHAPDLNAGDVLYTLTAPARALLEASLAAEVVRG